MKRVALVEDNEDNQVLFSAMLEDLYEVVCYPDGVAGLEGICADVPDLVLLDISLPEMDGLEVLARLRTRSDLADLPIVALTAHAMVGDSDRLLARGFDAYIAKPVIEDDDLLGPIARLLQNGRDR